MPPERIPTSVLPLKNDVLLILLALGAEPLHGYALMERIEAESGVLLQAGAFYRTLRNMLNDRLVKECDPADTPAPDAKKRRFYRITRHGALVAQAEIERLEDLVKRGRARAFAKRAR
jgi:DNA-binding PadR family transcriptional regulator